MRTLLLVIYFYLAASTILLGQNLKIRFINNTGRDIENLVINGTTIGNISADSTSNYIAFKKVKVGGGHFHEPMKCIIDTVRINGGEVYDFENKDAQYLTTGTFTYKITLFKPAVPKGKPPVETIYIYKVD